MLPMTEPIQPDPPKRKRHWFQFSLRTLLLAIAIVAVQCAVCLPMLREWQQRKQNIKELERLLAATTIRWRGSPGSNSSGVYRLRGYTSIPLDDILDRR
jgi:hypothetical protein